MIKVCTLCYQLNGKQQSKHTHLEGSGLHDLSMKLGLFLEMGAIFVDDCVGSETIETKTNSYAIRKLASKTTSKHTYTHTHTHTHTHTQIKLSTEYDSK